MITIPTEINSLMELNCYRSAIASVNIKGGSVYYSPREWVPDEYENLERAGLVRCEFGISDTFVPSLKSRCISLTKLGKTVADKITVALIPPFVVYSFHSALNRL